MQPRALVVMGVRVLFSSDLHGNDDHLARLLRRAEHEGCDVVILGGDLGPRGAGYGRDAGLDGVNGPSVNSSALEHLPKLASGKIDWDTDEALVYMREGYESQREWFTTILVPMLDKCRVPSVCLFGNSDWAGLLPVARGARKGREARGLRNDHEKDHENDRHANGVGAHVRFTQGDGDCFTVRTLAVDGENVPFGTCDILALSLVPISGHRKKDWERCDTKKLRETVSRTGEVAASGFFSSPDGGGAVRGAVAVSDQGAAENSIETHLEQLIERIQGKETEKVESPVRIWVTHAPPANSVGDMVLSGDSVGSLAVRRAIESYSPAMTLHGHIHESVNMHDGVFKELIQGKSDPSKNTLVCSVGNDFKERNPHALLFDTSDVTNVRRVEVE